MKQREFSGIHTAVFRFVISSALGSLLTVLTPVPLVSAPAAHYLSPVPGSARTTPQSNIIIRPGPVLNEADAADPSLLTVEGSVSGTISGKLILSDDRRPLVFVPSRQFQPGEAVTVSTRAGLHSASGEAVAPVHFGFTISALTATTKAALERKAAAFYYPPTSAGSAVSAGTEAAHKSASSSYPPSLPVPVVKTFGHPTAGSVFFSPWKLALTSTSIGYVLSDNQYLLVLGDDNKPAFYQQLPEPAFDFKMLANGTVVYFDAATARHVVLDNTYAPIDSFACGNGYMADPHDVLLLPNGHYMVIGLDPELVDMSTVVTGGMQSATVIGFVIQELDRAKNVVFEWKSIDHLQVTDAIGEDLTAETIDYAHPNALEIDTDSNILVSDRHMDEITKIDKTTGEIMWRWGGKNNQFSFVNDSLGFSHQHSIIRTDKGTYMLFDNGNFHTPQFSRAAEYALDTTARTATLVWQFRHSPDVFATAMGSVERLANGNTFIGWGAGTVAATEVRPDGVVEYESVFPDSVISYRAFKFQWNAATSQPVERSVPGGFSLSQNYPNPFNPSTEIAFTTPAAAIVRLTVYDVLGKEVRTIVSGALAPGTHAYNLDAGGLASGLYFYRLVAAPVNGARTFTDTKKFLILR